MNGNRSALWALLGVLMGFGLPVCACVGLGVAFSVGLGSLASGSATTPDTPIHVSGPATGPAVALIDVQGPIVGGESTLFASDAVAASGDLVRLIRRAGRNADVKAIVLRVNTPGGAVVASDEIYHALQEVGKPIVVYMGDTAASGGYYISMAADHIVANPNTLTGSIGVIMELPDAQELLEKVGVEFRVFKSGDVKDIGSPYRPMSEEEAAILQGIIDETYENFVEIVAEGRDMSEEEVREIADGRIFTGEQALELGLVDAVGYEEDAVAEAASLGGIAGQPRVVRYEPAPSFLSILNQRAQALSLLGVPPSWLERLMGPSLEYRWNP